MTLTVGLTGCSSTLATILMKKMEEDDRIDKIKGIDIKPPQYDTDILEFTKGDVRDPELLKSCFQGCDVVIHTAFIVFAAPNNIEQAIDINVEGSKTVIKTTDELDIPKLIYISSIAAYGFHKNRYVDQELLSEDDEIKGHENDFFYLYSKGKVEKFIEEFNENSSEDDMIVTRIRPPIIAGPHYNKLVNMKNIKSSFRKNQRYTMIKSRNSTSPLYQLVHEEDLVDAIIHFIFNDLHGAINIAGDPVNMENYVNGKGMEFREVNYYIARIVAKISKWRGKLTPVEEYWLQAGKYDILVDNTKAQSLFTDIKSTKEILDEIYEIVSN